MTGLEAARWEMIEAGGRTTQSFGLSRLFGQLYVLLYLTRRPLCLDDLAVQLAVSKASVSIACRQLEAWGAIHSVWVKGDRRDFYEAETDFGKLLNGGLLDSLGKKLESAQRQIARSLRLVEQSGQEDEQARHLRKRLQDAEYRRSRLARVLRNPLLRKLL